MASVQADAVSEVFGRIAALRRVILDLVRKAAQYCRLSLAFLIVPVAIHPACAEDMSAHGAQFRSLLGFEVSAGVSMRHIQRLLGSTKAFKAGEFERAICYYRKQTAMTLTSFQGNDDRRSHDTFDMYEVSWMEPGVKKNCASLPSNIPDAAFEPNGLKLGMSIAQFQALTGSTAADEMQNGVKSSRVFQKFLSPTHYIYAQFDTNGLMNFRVQ